MSLAPSKKTKVKGSPKEKRTWSENLAWSSGSCSARFLIGKWFVAEITFKIKSRLFTSAVSIKVDFQLKGNTECIFYCKPGRMRPSGSWGTSLRLLFLFSLYNLNCESQSPQRTRTASISSIKSTLGCSSDYDTQLRFHLWTPRTLTCHSLRSDRKTKDACEPFNCWMKTCSLMLVHQFGLISGRNCLFTKRRGSRGKPRVIIRPPKPKNLD